MSVLVVYRELEDGRRYADALELVGGDPLLAEATAGLSLGAAGGLLLTGGSDVNPALYHEMAQPETDTPDDERDAVEGHLIDEALTRGLPVFAICRGMQILNAHLGGTLTQHLATTAFHRRRTEDRGLPAHAVAIAPGTLLATIAGTSEWQVNSRHHQAVARLAPGLSACARSEDDQTIEAVEMPGRRFVLAVQWHPEDQALRDPEQRKLFQSFVNAL
ncbi:MAG: gamma-glutamyl-gamma-aminobutyrate hydrolase family protein [Terriglobia bacterium]